MRARRRRRSRIDYEVLEPLTDPFEALKPGAPLVHPPETFGPRQSNILQPTTAFSRGDVDAALAKAAHVIEATFQTQPIEIAFLEPEACLAVPQGDGVKVFTDSQGSVYDHQQIAKVLNLDPKHVEIALLPERRRVRRERRAVDPGADGDRRACSAGR